jgi:hypothetical protein
LRGGGRGKAEHGIGMIEHGNELCGEKGMRKTELGMTEQRMVAEHGMTDYYYSLNK